MLNSNFSRKSSLSFKQPSGKNIASFFTKMLNPVYLELSYDSACSYTPQQILTCNTNTAGRIFGWYILSGLVKESFRKIADKYIFLVCFQNIILM